MSEIRNLFALVLDRRLLTWLFLAGFVLALLGNLVAGPPIGLRSAIATGVLLAVIPVTALLFAFARYIAELVLMLPLILLVSLSRGAYLRWRTRQESIVVEQLIQRSYGPRRSPRRRTVE